MSSLHNTHAGLDAVSLEDENNVTLRRCIEVVLAKYFDDLNGHSPGGLYDMVLQEVEQPLLAAVLDYTRGNQSKAAEVLGINRGTLRKKLKQYNMA